MAILDTDIQQLQIQVQRLQTRLRESGVVTEDDQALLAHLSELAALGAQHIETIREADRRSVELEAVFAGLVDPMIIFDAQGLPVRANQAARSIYGPVLDYMQRTQQDMAQAAAASLIDIRQMDGRPVRPEELPIVRALRGDIVAGERYRLIDADGCRHTVVVAAAPVYIGGHPQGAVLSWHDITEAEELLAEVEKERQQLAEQQAFLQAVVEQMPSGVVIAEAGSGRVVLANKQIAEIWGRPFVQLANLAEFNRVYPVFHSDGRPYEVSDRPLWRALEQAEHIVGEEMLIERTDGTRGSVMASAAPVRDGEGNVIAAVVVLTDITERKHAEQRLAQQARILEQMNDAVIVIDDQAHVLYWNQAAQRIYGWTAREALGRNLHQLLRTQFRDGDRESTIRILEETGQWRGDVIQYRKDGSPVDIESRVTTMWDDVRCLMLRLGVNRNVTERKRQEAILRENQARLAALEAIIGERERLGRDLDDGVAQVLGYVRFKLHAIGNLLKDGRLAEAQAGVTELEEATRVANADLRQAIAGLRISSLLRMGLIASLGEYLTRFQEEWHIETGITVDPDVPTRFSPTTEVQLLSIINEAMNNIRKHAEARRATIRFAQDDGRVVISIEDDGRGFNPAHVGRSHYGLGIMQERARLIGAELTIESWPDQGTRVIIRLPMSRQGEP